MPLFIQNGQIVTASDIYQADIYCQDETISSIGRGLSVPPGAAVIDARGKYVFPGFVDPHVHIYLPFMGTYAKDTYETASRAALVGGTTTLIEMACPARSDEPLAAFELWKSKGEGHSFCDFTFHMGATRFDPLAESQLKEIVAAGVSSFKVFLAYKGALGVDDAELCQVMRLAKSLGVIVTAHCENADAVAMRQKELIAAGKTGPQWHEPSRPESVEAMGVQHLTGFAAMHDTHCYIVHTSCEPAARQALEARARGGHVWIETLIQFLTLDKTHAELPDFEGSKFVMSPPLRDKRNQPFLWNNLANGNVSTVATDQRSEGDGARGFHQDSQRDSVAGRPHQRVVHGGREIRQTGPVPIRRLCFNPGGQIVRPVSAQGRHPNGERRGPGGLRSELPRRDQRQNTADGRGL